MGPFASKQELLDFQDRWLRPAGILAIVGAILFAGSLALQQVGLADNDADRLTKFHDHSTQLLIAQGVVQGLGFLMFAAPLYVLFRCAQGRSEQVRGALLAFVFIGPVLFAASNLVLAIGLKDVSQKFVDQLPAKERQAEQQAASQAATAKGGGGGKSETGAKPGTTSTGTQSSGTTGTQTTGTSTSTTTTTPKTPEEAKSDAREDLASDLIDDSSMVRTGALLRFPGILALVIALVYIPLWAMRVGLLTRFWATLGMALGASLILLPFGILGLVLWFAAVGLMLAGWWPGPRPPAWEAGEAIPWPSRDDMGPPEAGGSPGAPVEGSGREVSEHPLPEEGPPSGPVGAPPDEGQYGETQGQRRKKRKRRD